jgi:hypothetical protein
MDSPHKAKVAAEKDLAIAAQLIEETGARIYEPALKRVSEQIHSPQPSDRAKPVEVAI